MTITTPEPDPASPRSCHSLGQAIQTSTHFLPALALSACALFISTGAQAQIKPEIANCVELKDEAIVAQAEMCSAHIGCVYMLNVQKTCAQAKGYLERLQTAIGEGTRNFFGSYRKEITPDAIFAAVLSSDEHASVRMLDAIPTSQRRSQEIAAKVRDAGTGDTLSGSWNGGNWVYYGQTQDGKAVGVGTRIFAIGEIHRGQFLRGSLNGAGEILYRSGARYIGDFAGIVSNQRSGQGAYIYKNGTKQEGSFSDGEIVSGTTYRPDGKVSEKGNYDKAGKLSFGQRFDTEGVPTVVNVRAEQEAAARAAAAAEQQRKLDEEQRRREAAAQAEQSRREAAAQAEQQFRASLQTMNPGQLFARADELSAQGDSARAREVQRALMSRFPNHPLAATAARQMAGESGANFTPPDNGGSSRNAASPAASTGTGLRPIWPSDMEPGNIYFVVEIDMEDYPPIMVSALSGQEAVARVQAARAKDRLLRPTTFKLLAGRECIGPAWGAVVTLGWKPWGAACANTPAAAIEGAFTGCRQQDPKGRGCEPEPSIVLALSGSTSWRSDTSAQGLHGRFGSYNAQTWMEQYTKSPINSMQQALSGFDKACADGRPCYKTSSNTGCMHETTHAETLEKCMDRKLTPGGLSGSIRSRLR